jgi:lysophospholipase L1-like esterase
VWRERQSPFNQAFVPYYFDSFTDTPGLALIHHTSDSGATYTQITGGSGGMTIGGAPGVFSGSLDSDTISQASPAAGNPQLLSATSQPAVNSAGCTLLIDCDVSATEANAVIISGTTVTASAVGAAASYSIAMDGTNTAPAPIAMRRYFFGGIKTVVTAFFNNSPVTTVEYAGIGDNIGTLGIGCTGGWVLHNASATQTSLPPVNAVVCEGDSLTWGGGGGVVDGGGATAGNSYPAVLQTALGGPTHVEVANIGYPGYVTSQMIASRTVQLLLNPVFTNRWGVFWGGTNDLFASETASTILANIAAWVTTVTTAGYSVVINQITYVGPVASSNYVAYNAIIDTVNASLVSTYNTSTRRCCQLNADPRLSDWTNVTYREADQTHFTAAGYAVVAALVQATLPIF